MHGVYRHRSCMVVTGVGHATLLRITPQRPSPARLAVHPPGLTSPPLDCFRPIAHKHPPPPFVDTLRVNNSVFLKDPISLVDRPQGIRVKTPKVRDLLGQVTDQPFRLQVIPNGLVRAKPNIFTQDR